MDTATQVQLLNTGVCISTRTYIFGKAWNPIINLPPIGK